MHKFLILISLFFVFANANINMNYYSIHCAKCHGSNGEKKAFGRTFPIRTLDKETFVNIIQGYQDKTYGGEMQYFMRHFVKDLSLKDIAKLYDSVTFWEIKK